PRTSFLSSSVSSASALFPLSLHDALPIFGIDAELVYSLPIDIDVRNALVMRNQAQFHPVAYLRDVLDAFTQNGGQVFEQTVVVKDRKSTRLNSSHVSISYAVFCLKKKRHR